MNAWPVAALPRTLAGFMAEAWAIEREAASRYAELAAVMEAHNNTEVAALLRTMAGYEQRHAQEICARMAWPESGPVEAAPARTEPPEAVSPDDLHYLMQPWHALQLALAAELRAQAFFEAAARDAGSDEVRQAALALAAEEKAHVALVQAWLAKVPPPAPGWADDPDPPRYDE